MAVAASLLVLERLNAAGAAEGKVSGRMQEAGLEQLLWKALALTCEIEKFDKFGPPVVWWVKGHTTIRSSSLSSSALSSTSICASRGGGLDLYPLATQVWPGARRGGRLGWAEVRGGL